MVFTACATAGCEVKHLSSSKSLWCNTSGGDLDDFFFLLNFSVLKTFGRNWAKTQMWTGVGKNILQLHKVVWFLSTLFCFLDLHVSLLPVNSTVMWPCCSIFDHFVKGPILCSFSSISHSCQRSNNTVFDMRYPKPICGPEFQLSKSCSTERYWEQAVSVPAPLNANELHLSTPTFLLHAPLRKTLPLMLVVACANVMADVWTCIAMARRDAFIQPHQFDPESDPEREAPEELQTLRLQQAVSEWLVCLNNVSLFACS